MAKHDRGPLCKLSLTIVSKFKQKKVLYVNVINWNVNLEVVDQGYRLKITLTSIRSIDETPTDYTVIFIPEILKHIKSKLNTKVLKLFTNKQRNGRGGQNVEWHMVKNSNKSLRQNDF